jgi:formylglycine-generating enzyme required for sulfatase activity
MVLVPEGSFTMGCTEGPGHCMEGEMDQPPHAVFVSAFEIDETEVSQQAYAACVAAAACTAAASGFDPGHDGALPVTNVSHDQARGYCAWAGKRLPTEAEWEKAARGTDERRYPWGDERPTCAQANLDVCGGKLRATTDPAARAGASPYGALDMAGNAEEWVADWFGATYYASSPARDPQGPAASTGSGYVVRGGSVRDDWWHAGASVRLWDDGGPSPVRGFRCARSK